MRRTAALLVLLAALLGLAGDAGATPSPSPPSMPPPRLQDVRIWYYPPERGARPVTLLWWQPENLRIQQRRDLSRRGRIRVRVAVSGGFEEDERGTLNWISAAFRDDNTSLFDMPHDLRETRGGVRDIVWRVPQVFAPGPIEVAIAAYGGRTPVTAAKARPADRMDWTLLGRVVD